MLAGRPAVTPTLTLPVLQVLEHEDLGSLALSVDLLGRVRVRLRSAVAVVGLHLDVLRFALG